ncbi:MAG: T9SS type A sorting domain-containing protein [Bacteroidota bacterium]|nr:T9SS type A sorting domain-containing protein [Bacteroidota bacterium]
MKKSLLFALMFSTGALVWGQNTIKSQIVPAPNVSALTNKVSSNNIGANKTLLCQDTLRYPQMKEQVLGASNFNIFELWTVDAEYMSQAYLLSGSSLSVSGVEVFGRRAPTSTANLVLRASIYNVDVNNNPTTEIAFANITISDTLYNYRQANFASAVTVSNNYAVVIRPTSAGGIVEFYINNSLPGQIYDEGLSKIRSSYYTSSSGNWVSVPTLTSGFTGGPYDFEMLVAAKVSYSINTNFVVTPPSVCLGTALNFSSTTTPSSILSSRFYNFNRFKTYFQSVPDSSYAYNMTGSQPFIWSANTSYTYSTAATHNPILYTLGGLWSSCLDNYTTAVTVNPTPVVTANSPVICSGQSATVTAISSITGGTYSWNTGATTASITVSPTITTNYTVIYTLNGCSSSTQITVTVNPNPTISSSASSSTICSGGNTALTASGGTTYSWSPSSSLTSATGASVTASPTATTTYTVTGTSNGCSSTSQVTVTVTPLDNATFTYPSNTVCDGSANVTPTVSSSGSFSASPTGLVFANSTTGEIDVVASATNSYIISYTTTGACPNTSTQTLNITTATDANFSYSNSNYCTSGTNPTPIYGTGASAGTFSSSIGLSINSGTGLIDLLNSTPGSYSVTNTIAASGSCPFASASITVVIDADPIVTLGTFLDVCSTAPAFNLSGGTPAGGTYSGNGVVSGTFDPSIAGVGTHSITYSYTDGNNCSASANESVIVDVCTGIQNIPVVKNLLIAPNPVRDQLNISFVNTSSEKIKVRIISADGKLLFNESSLNSEIYSKTIDVSSYAKGVYFIQIVSEIGTVTNRIIVQ